MVLEPRVCSLLEECLCHISPCKHNYKVHLTSPHFVLRTIEPHITYYSFYGIAARGIR